jgi:hypothetical protein
LIWLEWCVPESSAGECNSAPYAWSLLDRLVFGRAHPCFYSGRLALEGVARSSVLSCRQKIFWSMVKLEAENAMNAGLEA